MKCSGIGRDCWGSACAPALGGAGDFTAHAPAATGCAGPSRSGSRRGLGRFLLVRGGGSLAAVGVERLQDVGDFGDEVAGAGGRCRGRPKDYATGTETPHTKEAHVPGWPLFS